MTLLRISLGEDVQAHLRLVQPHVIPSAAPMKTFPVLIAALLLVANTLVAEIPAGLKKALESFDLNGAPEWGFVKTSVDEKEKLVERYDPAAEKGHQWTLIKFNGKTPTADQLKTYAQKDGQRSANGNSDGFLDQLEFETAEKTSTDGEFETWRIKIPPEEGDEELAALGMVTNVTWHPASGTITRYEIINTAAYSPVTGVKISLIQTVLTYTLPENGRPSLPAETTVHFRGRAFVVKSLNKDASATFSDYFYAGKPASAATAEPATAPTQ